MARLYVSTDHYVPMNIKPALSIEPALYIRSDDTLHPPNTWSRSRYCFGLEFLAQPLLAVLTLAPPPRSRNVTYRERQASRGNVINSIKPVKLSKVRQQRLVGGLGREQTTAGSIACSAVHFTKERRSSWGRSIVPSFSYRLCSSTAKNGAV